MFTPKKINPHFAFQMRSWNPWGINVRELCSKIDFPPIPTAQLQGKRSQNVETVLTKLVPAYLERRKIFALDDALWRYWSFQELPLGINLPMLVNGFEILARAWFGSSSSTSTGNFTAKKEFASLLKSDFNAIRKKLTTAAQMETSMSHLNTPDVLDGLMRRLENSFEMGQNAKIQAFFRELGVNPTKAQMEALKARNEQIHGDSAGKEPRRLWSLSENLRTLFYKTILRLLDYSGDYLDWASQKPAVKQLRAESRS